MSTLKYSEWRAEVLEKIGHPFKMVRDLAKVDVTKVEGLEIEETYQSFKDKLIKQIKDETLKAGKKGKEEPEPTLQPQELELPIVQLSEIEQPPIEPTQTEEEEIAELVQLSKRGQIKLPNVTHVPGRTYPELKKVKQEKQQSKLDSSTKQKQTSIASAGATVVEGIEKNTCPAASIFKINTGDFLIGFGVGLLVTTLINVVRNIGSSVA